MATTETIETLRNSTVFGTATSATQTDQVRLRKVVRTETETVEVPVRKKENVVEGDNK